MFREGREFSAGPEAWKKDYYAVLGVNSAAGDAEIRSAYLRLAKATHPDRYPNNPKAEEAFKQANEAYSILSDKNRKAQYDLFRLNSGLANTEADYQSRDKSFRASPGKLRPRRVAEGLCLSDSENRRMSDYFIELLNYGNVYVGRYRDGAYCLVSPESGKTLTRGYRKLEFFGNFVIGVLRDSGKQVLVNPESGRESKEFWKIKIKDGKAWGKNGFISYEPVSAPY